MESKPQSVGYIVLSNSEGERQKPFFFVLKHPITADLHPCSVTGIDGDLVVGSFKTEIKEHGFIFKLKSPGVPPGVIGDIGIGEDKFSVYMIDLIEGYQPTLENLAAEPTNGKALVVDSINGSGQQNVRIKGIGEPVW